MPPSRAPSDNPLEASDDDRTEVFKLDQLLDTVEQAPPPREPVLVCLIGSAQGTVYRLGQGPCEIGRDGRQIRLTD
ncbi:MAG: hypothetical protein MUF54_12965, partial [Polyangiaceae bacterium]|nr:hypothetical protein [Polyangiaceae bacterium]